MRLYERESFMRAKPLLFAAKELYERKGTL
jgi:hypothetical protein